MNFSLASICGCRSRYKNVCVCTCFRVSFSLLQSPDSCWVSPTQDRISQIAFQEPSNRSCRRSLARRRSHGRLVHIFASTVGVFWALHFNVLGLRCTIISLVRSIVPALLLGRILGRCLISASSVGLVWRWATVGEVSHPVCAR